MNRVGLVGVGLMGTAIAERLIDHGYELLAWDVNLLRRSELVNRGGKWAESLAQVLMDCDIVLLSLPNDQVVCSILEEDAKRLRHGQHIIDTSTGDPPSVTALSHSLQQRGIEYLDATISGSSAQVRDGSCVVLVGASEKGLAACEAILHSIAEKVLHVGPPGSGSQMKLVTNLVLGLNRAALAEGLAFANSMNLPLGSTLEVLRTSMAYSRIMDTKGDKMIAREYSPQAKLAQHAKDVRLMLSSADLNELKLPLCETHLLLLEQAMQLGFADADNSAIFEAYGHVAPEETKP